MLIIIYAPDDRDAPAIGDGFVEETFQAIVGCLPVDTTLYFSTSNIFDRIRLGLVRDELSPEDVHIMFNEERVYFNEYGACQHWPDGFCELDGILAESIIKEAIEKKRRLRGDSH